MSTYSKASFLDDFELPEITFESIKSELVKVAKISKSPRRVKEEDLPLDEKLKLVRQDVYKVLGKYKGFVKVIDTYTELDKYIDKVIKAEIVAIDTETNNSLDPLTCDIMGICMYIPNTRPIYVPMNHCEPGTENRLPNQINEAQAKELLSRLKNSKTKIIYHNGKFDIRVIKNTIGIYMPIWWDTMLAAQLINENERAGLKMQYRQKVDPTTNVYGINKLFRKIPYKWIDVWIFALYAAIDSYDTYKLQQVQEKHLSQPGFERLKKLFLEIEVPTSQVVAKMEDTGISIDLKYTKRIDTLFKQNLEKSLIKLNELLEPYTSQIRHYQSINKLDTPINFNSSTQLQLLMYTIMQQPPNINGETKTDANTLKYLDTDFSRTLLEYRHYFKMITSFTDSLPKKISTKTGKIHAEFNQLGREEKNVVTGRFSSKDPNMQQIPSEEKTVRLMFKGSDDYFESKIDSDTLKIKDYWQILRNGEYIYAFEYKNGQNIDINVDGKIENITIRDVRYIKETNDVEIVLEKWTTGFISVYINYIIIGGDFSQQEPRLLTHMSKDQKLIDTYNSGKDLYAVIGASIYKKDYWDCMEYTEDGVPNPEGKAIRSKAKLIVLGVMYGMGARLLASILNVSVDECKQILHEFFEIFPTVKEFSRKNEEHARKFEYVEDYMGRRRHLPDINLPELEITAYKNVFIDNVFLDDVNDIIKIPDEELTDQWIGYYEKAMRTYGNRWEKKRAFKARAEQAKVRVIDNGAFISKTLTQSANAPIQGSAASLTKKAMVIIHRDDRLNNIGFNLLVPVHDELLGEVPVLHKENGMKWLTENMIKAGEPECSVKMKVDSYASKNWNLDEVTNVIVDMYKRAINGTSKSEPISHEEAIENIKNEYMMLDEETILSMCAGTYDVLKGNL